MIGADVPHADVITHDDDDVGLALGVRLERRAKEWNNSQNSAKACRLNDP